MTGLPFLQRWAPRCLLMGSLGSHALAEISRKPLAARPAAPADSARFTRQELPFTNHGGPQRTDAAGRVIFFATSSGKDTSGGVAIGDYDGDGLQDVFLTRAKEGSRLLRNRGDCQFEDVTETAGLDDPDHWSTGASFADIDNDGDLDLAVCGYDCPVRVHRNNGDGTFTECAAALGLAFRGAAIMPGFADYDNDGDLDLFILTNYLERSDDADPVRLQGNPATGEIVVPEEKRESLAGVLLPDGTPKTFRSGQIDRLYRNDGKRFTDVTAASGISGYETGLSVTWWDYDRDGFPDIYVANDFYGQDRCFHNNRDGTFTDVIRRMTGHTPWYSMGTDTADINNDGLPDFFATDMAGANHYKDKIGMGDMEESAWFLDLAEPRQYMHNALYLNSGTARFQEISHLAGVGRSDWTWSPNFGDLDNDGLIDLFITNGMTRDLFNSDLKREEAFIMASGSRERAARFWASREPKKDRNFVFRNRDGLRFSDESKAWGLDYAGVSFGSAEADLDNDGDLDIVVNNYGEPASLFRNSLPGPARALAVQLSGRTANRHGIGATVEVSTGATVQMRYLTLTRGYMSSPGTRLHFGLGAAQVAEKVTVHWPGGRVQVLKEVPADHLLTITEPDADDSGVQAAPAPGLVFRRLDAFPAAVTHNEEVFDDFAEQPLLPNKMSQLGPGMAWGDVDGDGIDELFLGGARGQSGRLLRKAGPGGAFTEVEQSVLAADRNCEDMGAVFFDADSDGDLDLYVASGSCETGAGDSTYQDRLYLNDGEGRFTAAPAGSLPEARNSSGVVAAADFDHDGDLDLFVGSRQIPGSYPQRPVSQLLRNDRGTFTDVAPAELAAAGLVTSALWSDVDNDGWLDLLVTLDWGAVTLFRNRGGVLGGEPVNSLTGWWNGIAAGDIDHDGDMDYAVTNFGLNTKYRADAQKPEVLYFGDLDGSGKRNLVEAKLIEGELYPRRGFSCSGTAMPALRQKLGTFHNFASARLELIYPADRLEKAERFEVNTLASGILLNDGTGRFSFRALPELAQVSPSFGVTLTDFDGDGHPDCVLAQNFYHPQRETTRMDSGLGILLKGDGTGNFTPVPPAASGIAISGDQKSLTVSDLDGDGRPDVVIAENDGPLRPLRGVADGSSGLAVRLAGPAGNPSGIGARITLKGDRIPPQTVELSAGGGYLSQSAPVAFLSLPQDRKDLRLEVRWPDGEISQHAVPDGSAAILTRP